MAIDKIRVEVWDGTGENYLGKGYYVGLATVNIVRSPDGTILSESNAEDPPSDSFMKQVEKAGGDFERLTNNPKIELDSGKVVYGCQVWWQPIPEEGGSDADRRTKEDEVLPT